MKNALIGLAMAALTLGSAAVVIGQNSPQPHRGSAENSLIGISLYDPGSKVISKYGSPDDILALNVGSSSAAGGGAGDGGGAGTPGTGVGGRGGAPQGGQRGPTGGEGAGGKYNTPFELVGDPFGNGQEWRQATLAPPDDGGGGDSGRGGGASTPNTGPGGTGGRGGGAASGGGGGKVIYTRWVYKRNGSRYAFVLDKFNRVIQIEAIGLKNSAVRTRRGITFGSSFSSLIKAYNAPDSYEINGDNLVVRFLVRDRVAFRMNRLQKDKPQVVTGVVVAAGKT
ncbi:MAG: hypothetical protein JNM28_00525 [Armatimonadetes bacterium]|nr:hypothetical protein [Armatimonadota bacterium]MBS1711323.1 hypothetical protein [Armatimonadota bacterium]MBX3107752.1 hypothetical protein [Fimbriimonadaceae bacterium]